MCVTRVPSPLPPPESSPENRISYTPTTRRSSRVRASGRIAFLTDRDKKRPRKNVSKSRRIRASLYRDAFERPRDGVRHERRNNGIESIPGRYADGSHRGRLASANRKHPSVHHAKPRPRVRIRAESRPNRTYIMGLIVFETSPERSKIFLNLSPDYANRPNTMEFLQTPSNPNRHDGRRKHRLIPQPEAIGLKFTVRGMCGYSPCTALK